MTSIKKKNTEQTSKVELTIITEQITGNAGNKSAGFFFMKLWCQLNLFLYLCAQNVSFFNFAIFFFLTWIRIRSLRNTALEKVAYN